MLWFLFPRVLFLSWAHDLLPSFLAMEVFMVAAECDGEVWRTRLLRRNPRKLPGASDEVVELECVGYWQCFVWSLVWREKMPALILLLLHFVLSFISACLGIIRFFFFGWLSFAEKKLKWKFWFFNVSFCLLSKKQAWLSWRSVRLNSNKLDSGGSLLSRILFH